MIFDTESGSTYEFDRTQRRIRKFAGGPGTERVGAGEWRPCLDVFCAGIGASAIIHWRDCGDRQECTMTSRVVAVREPEA